MFLFLPLLFLILSSLAAMGQTIIPEKVQPNKGRPVTAASITSKDTCGGAVAGSTGIDRFNATGKPTIARTVLYLKHGKRNRFFTDEHSGLHRYAEITGDNVITR